MIDPYATVRARTAALAARLTPEDQLVQSMPDASPTKWHLAHTTWFFETFVLKPHLPGYRPLDDRFDYLFNSYYEAVGPRVERSARGMLSRPSLDEVHAYRSHVDEAMAVLLARPIPAEIHERIALGLAHEEQHQELILTDIKHAFWRNPTRPAYEDRDEGTTALAQAGWTDHPEGISWIGHGGDGFSFDNERPRHRVFLHAYALANRPVTNGEYLAFMQDGGYTRASLWLSDGWLAVNAERWSAPLYWEERDGAWWQLTLSGMQPVPRDQPVCHVSQYEADAFARWAGARLPTEAEWERGASARRLPGVVWEWTASAYAAYPGYRPDRGALGEYNGKFMSGQSVLRGGSRATPASHIRPTYRNFFPPSARWQFSGLRLAKDA